jgi:hypothetical protein
LAQKWFVDIFLDNSFSIWLNNMQEMWDFCEVFV